MVVECIKTDDNSQVDSFPNKSLKSPMNRLIKFEIQN